MDELMKCRHPGCNRPAYKPYHRDGIEVIACKYHLGIIIGYLKKNKDKDLSPPRERKV